MPRRMCPISATSIPFFHTRPSGNMYLLYTNKEAGLFGAYILFDNNADEFIRDRVASGVNGFGGHCKEHEKRAKDERNDGGSRFYVSYPSRQSLRSKSHVKGEFF